MVIPRGRLRGDGPFGGEDPIRARPRRSTHNSIRDLARRNYSQFKGGPTLEDEDLRDQGSENRRKKQKTVATVATPVPNP